MLTPFTIPLAGLIIVWVFSALFLTLGIYIVGKIFGWRGDVGFWSPFPIALLTTAILTIVDWGLAFIPIPFFASILRIIIWFLVIMKVFSMEFIEALILAIVLFFAKILFITFVLTALFSIVT